MDMSGYKPRLISLTKRPGHTFGFYLRMEQGEDGHLIRCLDMGGPAELAGMKDGDRLLRVNGKFVDGLCHSEVVDLVRNSGVTVAFHILDEASYKQAKTEGVNLSNPQSPSLANGVAKHAPKPKLCYLIKSKSGYGFSLRSVKDEPGVFFVIDVLPGNVAHMAGVKVNDRLLEINGENVEDASHDQVVDKIKSSGDKLMILLADEETHEHYKSKLMKIGSWLATIKYLPHKPRSINMTKASDGYGFLLREDPKQSGHFMKNIDKGSPADRGGMKEADRLLAVDGKDVEKCSHEQVVDMIGQSGNKCNLLVIDKETDQMFKLGKVSPIVFYEDKKTSNLPPSYSEALNLPTPGNSSVRPQVTKEELKPKLCTLEKASAGYGFHLNGIQGVCGQYIHEVVKGGAADRAGLEDDDILVEVNGVNVEKSTHEEVVEMIKRSDSRLEMLVASRSVYDQLTTEGVTVTRLLLGNTSYAQVHHEDSPGSNSKARQEDNAKAASSNKAVRERKSSSSSEDSVDVRL
ncbi:Na(+)/H(+) exchange regulatory cofactor NHE-RF3 isoform X2 [Antennarius striatus]|uniref:Na(+)/H(+) exchange regulatory cofactor NHE-RF3 isoform X2 n=1 Tax=Antennarius striatus TaxID=241820 RepID=UPI0035B1F835